MRDNPFDIKKTYLDSLKAAWDSYIKLIDILIGVSGATALVFFNTFKAEEWAKLPHAAFVKFAIGSSAVALVSAIFWRATAQHFLEYETIGDSKWANEFFGTDRIASVVTTAHRSQFQRRYYAVAFRLLPWTTSVSIITSWVAVYGTFFGFRPFGP
jgi:hypothetical protein